jgi:hypothetical protein
MTGCQITASNFLCTNAESHTTRMKHCKIHKEEVLVPDVLDGAMSCPGCSDEIGMGDTGFFCPLRDRDAVDCAFFLCTSCHTEKVQNPRGPCNTPQHMHINVHIFTCIHMHMSRNYLSRTCTTHQNREAQADPVQAQELRQTRGTCTRVYPSSHIEQDGKCAGV